MWVTIKDGMVVGVCSPEGWKCPLGEVTFTLTLAMWPGSPSWGGIFVCSVLLLRLDVSQIKNFKFSQIVPGLFLALVYFYPQTHSLLPGQLVGGGP